jgi:hypothetical protein
MHCAGCGYLAEYHDVIGRCPDGDGGYKATVKFRPPEPVVERTWREILAADAARWRAEAEEARKPYEPKRTPPPLVPARPPQRPEEYATSNRGLSAAKLGRKAVELGWEANALYWVGHDGAEGCGLWVAKGSLRAVALWKRKAEQAGNLAGWGTDIAYAWRTDIDRFPTKLTHTDLEGLIA